MLGLHESGQARSLPEGLEWDDTVGVSLYDELDCVGQEASDFLLDERSILDGLLRLRHYGSGNRHPRQRLPRPKLLPARPRLDPSSCDPASASPSVSSPSSASSSSSIGGRHCRKAISSAKCLTILWIDTHQIIDLLVDTVCHAKRSRSRSLVCAAKRLSRVAGASRLRRGLLLVDSIKTAL